MAPDAKLNFWGGAIFKSIDIPNFMFSCSSIYIRNIMYKHNCCHVGIFGVLFTQKGHVIVL